MPTMLIRISRWLVGAYLLVSVSVHAEQIESPIGLSGIFN